MVGSKLKVYTNGTIVSLAIPTKWRLRTEAKRMVKNWYTLICSAGPLSGTHTAGQLNPVLSPDESLLPLKFPANEARLTINKVSGLFYRLNIN
jgi:hypothetical protein